MPILNWLTRDEDVRAAERVPYRLLEEDAALSVGDAACGNMLMQGDNLEALKALLPFYAGRVKCIYIDPPYNTGEDFEHYEDNLEHTKWLAMMWPRLELLRELLAEDGSIWVNIDDVEGHYLKVVMDEIFGRKNFVANVLWQKRTSPDARLKLGAAHDHILAYAKDVTGLALNQIPLTPEQEKNYKNLDNDPRGRWASRDITGQTGHATPSQYYTITTPAGVEYPPPSGRCWAISESSFLGLVEKKKVWFGKDGKSRPRLKRYLSEVSGVSAWTWWSNEEVGHNQESKKEVIALFGKQIFKTPKPERLLQRILHIATNPGDLVLDSFLGSGTTAAVAHKMGRRYIGIEMGEHAVTHCAPRLRKVIEGEQGGISKSVGWQGGGGFRFLRLGPAVFDEDGRIQKAVRFPALAAHVWFSETGQAWRKNSASALLGLHDGRAYALLYNGILGDKRPGGGNVLTRATLTLIRDEISKRKLGVDTPLTIYGEQSRLMPATLEREGIVFKQTPYDIKVRA